MSSRAISTHRVTPVTEIIPSGGDGHHAAYDSHRKRPFHIAVALQFSMGGHAENGEPEIIDNDLPQTQSPVAPPDIGQSTVSFAEGSRLRAQAGPVHPAIAVQIYRLVRDLG